MFPFKKKFSFNQKMAVFAFISAVFVAINGNPNPSEKANLIDSIAGEKIDFITARDLAELIMYRKIDFLIIDLREEDKYRKYHIPGAKNSDEISHPDSTVFFSLNTIILYDDNQNRAAEKWLTIKEANHKNVMVLKGGIKAWANEVLFPDLTGQINLNTDPIESIKKMSLYFGGRPKLNTAGKNSLSRRYNREGC